MSELAGHDQVQRSIFKRHTAKLLNLCLLLYLALGASIFEYLEESPSDLTKSVVPKRNPPKLVDLRQSSVRRMWNITNRLNILYEANWTALVLDELVEFERQLVDSLERSRVEREMLESGQGAQDELEDEQEGRDEDGNDKQEKDASSKKKDRKRSRSGSIKKSFVHSLATITTIGKQGITGF